MVQVPDTEQVPLAALFAVLQLVVVVEFVAPQAVSVFFTQEYEPLEPDRW